MEVDLLTRSAAGKSTRNRNNETRRSSIEAPPPRKLLVPSTSHFRQSCCPNWPSGSTWVRETLQFLHDSDGTPSAGSGSRVVGASVLPETAYLLQRYRGLGKRGASPRGDAVVGSPG